MTQGPRNEMFGAAPGTPSLGINKALIDAVWQTLTVINNQLAFGLRLPNDDQKAGFIIQMTPAVKMLSAQMDKAYYQLTGGHS